MEAGFFGVTLRPLRLTPHPLFQSFQTPEVFECNTNSMSWSLPP
jgi:hypothetical protein